MGESEISSVRKIESEPYLRIVASVRVHVSAKWGQLEGDLDG